MYIAHYIVKTVEKSFDGFYFNNICLFKLILIDFFNKKFIFLQPKILIDNERYSSKS